MALKVVGCSCCGARLVVPDWSRKDDRVCNRCGSLGFPRTCLKCRG